MQHFPTEIEYSDKYFDDEHEFRHVILSEKLYRKMSKNKLLSEPEWRALGVQQSLGWVHYEIYKPEPHILLFRRKLNINEYIPVNNSEKVIVRNGPHKYIKNIMETE